MSTIGDIFTKKQAFISYITAGDGGLDYSEQALLALVKGGVDILEIGVPFSDPVADGPVIEQAMGRALAHHITMPDIFGLVQRVRSQCDVPIILFTYYNPVLAALKTLEFYSQAKECGVDGLLVVDLPPQEAGAHYQQCQKAGLDPICLIVPDTSKARIAEICQHASGFLYYVCRTGTTGVREQLPADIIQQLSAIKSQTQLPIAVGFGIADKKSVQTLLKHADGFVVGSYFVQAIARQASPSRTDGISG